MGGLLAGGAHGVLKNTIEEPVMAVEPISAFGIVSYASLGKLDRSLRLCVAILRGYKTEVLGSNP